MAFPVRKGAAGMRCKALEPRWDAGCVRLGFFVGLVGVGFGCACSQAWADAPERRMYGAY
jgi:hypothetical protein